ncbi:MAG: calcium/sodium antiporter [Succinivibrionaceae bacterium]
MELIYYIIALVIGLVLLVWSADRFIDGASRSAIYFNMPSILVGVVIVGFGTSAPELLVSLLAGIDEKSNLALGNAIGSNIANIALILGATAIIHPIIVHKRILKNEYVQLFVINLIISSFIIFEQGISRLSAIIMFTILFLTMTYTILRSLRYHKKQQALNKDAVDNEIVNLKKEDIKIGLALFWLLVGITILVLSSKILVWGAVGVAQTFNVSEVIIGLTIVAIGTSLPELASSIVAAKKGEQDIAIGNVIGSNIFNLTAVTGIATIVTPIENIDKVIIYRDISLMIFLTVTLFVFAYPQAKFNSEKGFISRFKGGVWLLIYVLYTLYLIYEIIQNGNLK